MNRRVMAGWGLLMAMAGASAGAETTTASLLPSEECVRMLREARIAHMSGDPAAELATLRAAEEAFPGEIAPIYALLEYHRSHDLPEEEQRELRARLSQRLSDPSHPLSPGVLHPLARDPAATEELLLEIAANVTRRLETAEGKEVEALLTLLATVQQRLGQVAEAAATLERLWQRTGDAEIAWALLQLDLRLERWAEALAVMETAEELREGPMRTTYIRVLARAGYFEKARSEVDRLAGELEAAGEELPTGELEITGFDPTVSGLAPLVEDLAWSFRDAGREAEAEALFRRALALRPGDRGLAAVLAHLYASEAERQAFADTMARQWQEVADPQALLDEGTRRLAAGDAEAALDLLARAAPHFPDLEAAWLNLGLAAYRLERWLEAEAALDRAAQLNPERAQSVFFRGLALVQVERCSEAVPALERALELEPSRYQAHYYLAGCYSNLGRPGDAERHRQLFDSKKDQ